MGRKKKNKLKALYTAGESDCTFIILSFDQAESHKSG